VLVQKKMAKKSRQLRKAGNAPIALWNSVCKQALQARKCAVRRLAIPPAAPSINHSAPSELKTILISV
jgi:hypothetical protein